VPSIEELKALVSEFRSQGVSDEEIRETLKEMNVGSDVIESLLGASESPPSTPEETQQPEPEPEPSPEEIPVPPLPQEPPEGPQEVEILPHIETAEHVKELHRKIDTLHEKVPSSDELIEIKERLYNVEEELRKLHGMMEGLKKLLQEILNTERSILVDLYERSKNCK